MCPELSIVVTGLGVICRSACGREQLPALAAATRADEERGDGWFDATRFLGPRGFKYLPPATRYMLAAAGLALTDAAAGDGHYGPDDKGVVVGSNFAVAALHDAMDRIILEQGADAISPMEAANFSINLAASHVSMKYGCKGFNICLTSGIVAGLEAVMVGAQALRRGRARLVVAGATEGPPPPELADFMGQKIEDGGACALALETAPDARRRGAKPLGRLLGGALAFFDPARLGSHNGHASLAAVVTDALNRTGISATGTVYLQMLSCEHPLNRAVGDIVSRAFEARGIDLSRDVELTDASLGTVSPMLQVALALYRRRDCVVVSTSPRGQIAIAAFAGVAPPPVD
jgi:3-oxoacyl-[acyl-carrier-protein] synthase II